jgi:hypothetical protein
MANSIGKLMARTKIFQRSNVAVKEGMRGTHVPGFWSWKGLVSTVLTLMVVVI